MLTKRELKRLLGKGGIDPDDIKILDSWAVYDTEGGKPVEERTLHYLCYKLEVVNPQTGKRFVVYKALKFVRIIRLPKDAKESLSYMEMHQQIIVGVIERGYNLVTLIANVMKPVALGLLFLYAVQGVGRDIETAKKYADSDFTGFLGMMQGTYRVLEMRYLQAQESEWLREKMYSMEFITAVKGIPKARAGGENAGNRGAGGKNLNPYSQGTTEELIIGLADYEYIVQILTSPVSLNLLKVWLLQNQNHMTEWYEQLQGTKSVNMNLSIPMMFMANMGQSTGSSKNYTEATGQSFSTNESFSTGYGESVSQSLSESISQSFSKSSGMTVSDSLSQSHSVSQGTSSGLGLSDNVGYSQGISANQGLGQSFNSNYSQGQNIGESYGLSEGTSYSVNQGESTGYSHNLGTSQNIGYNIGESYGQSQGVSVGNSVSHSLGQSYSENVSNSWSQGSSFGQSSSVGNSLSAGFNAGNSNNQGYSESSGSNWGGSAFGFSGGASSSSSESTGVGNSQGNSFGVGQSSSNSVSYGNSATAGYSKGYGFGQSESVSSSSSVNQNASVSHGTSYGQSENFGISESFGVNSGQSRSQGWGASSSASEGVSYGQNESNSWGQGISQNLGTGQSEGVSQGSGISQSFSQNASESFGINQGRSVGRSESVSEGVSYSEGISNGWGENRTVGQSLGTGESTSVSESNSIGRTLASTSGTSGSMGLGPSIGYGKSYQWLDQGVKDILELLEFENMRLKSALRGQGASYCHVYIAAESEGAIEAAAALAKSTWVNEEAMTNPLYVMDLDEEEQAHLLYHFSAFSTDITREKVFGIEQYKFSTVLLPAEITAYTHLPRVSEGGIYAEVSDIPKFAVPSMMKGEIFLGNILSAERYTMEQGYNTKYEFRLDESELMHGYVTGASRSGKTVAAMRLVAELTQVRRKKTGKRLRIVVMDPKKDWRTLAKLVEPERLNFYSLGNLEFHPLSLNLCKIPYGVWPQTWVDTMIEIYCRCYGLLERGKQLLGETFYSLYDEAGVFAACDKENWREIVPELSKTVTFTKAYERMTYYKRQLEDPMNTKGRAGNDTRDAYARLLDRLSAFGREYSIERKLFGNEDGLGIDELIGKDDITILESKGLESTFKNFVFGCVVSGFYRFALGHEAGFLSDDEYETVLVLEEANEVLVGSDMAGSGNSMISLGGQSEFEEILDQSAGYGLFIVAITQKISDLPKSIIANAGIVLAGKLKTEDDVKVVIRSIAKEERYEDRDILKWLPRSPIGWFIVQSSRCSDFKDAEPVLVKIARLNVNPPSNAELEELLAEKESRLRLAI